MYETQCAFWLETWNFPTCPSLCLKQNEKQSWSCKGKQVRAAAMNRSWTAEIFKGKVLNKLSDTKLDYSTLLTSTNKTTSAPCFKYIHVWLYNMTHLLSCVHKRSYIITTETSRARLSVWDRQKIEMVNGNDKIWKKVLLLLIEGIFVFVEKQLMCKMGDGNSCVNKLWHSRY